eukprot:scaffold43352_cov70-Phaeocystis_antarctica.AAC.6
MAEPTTVARKQMGTLALKIREPSVTSVTANSCSKGVTYGEARLTMLEHPRQWTGAQWPSFSPESAEPVRATRRAVRGHNAELGHCPGSTLTMLSFSPRLEPPLRRHSASTAIEAEPSSATPKAATTK